MTLDKEARTAHRLGLSIGFVLTEHFTLSALSLFIDQLRLASGDRSHASGVSCEWAIMTGHGELVRSSSGLAVQCIDNLLAPECFDYLVVIGGMPEQGRQYDLCLLQYLREAASSSVRLVGVCGGVFMLCQAGLMVGRRCCVSWHQYQSLADQYPDCRPVSDRLFIDDGDRITCAGGVGASDLASYLIDRHLGSSAMQNGRHLLLLDTARNGDTAQPRPPAISSIADKRIRRAVHLMEQHIAAPLTIDAIADRAGLSVRQLERRFQLELNVRPAAFYRALRLRHAQWLLDHTGFSITDVALDAGYGDCAHFSRQFKAAFGCKPTEFRSRDRDSDSNQNLKSTPMEISRQLTALAASEFRVPIR